MDPINYPFTAIDLTSEINRLDNVWGMLQQLGLFPGQGVSTTMVEIAMEDGRLKILAAEERGAPGSQGRIDPEKSIILKVPSFPHDETIKPEDLQDRFVFGSNRQQRRSVQTETAKKLARLRQLHALTLEYLRMGALKGEIVDGRNRTIYDLFDVFQIQKKVVYFDFEDDDSDIMGAIEAVLGHMEDHLRGETMDGARAIVSPEFFLKLRQHPKVEKFFLNWQAATALAGRETGDFELGGLRFRSYRATATDMTGASRRFVTADKGHAYPTGTTDAHETYFAPAHHVAMANTLGTEIFVSPEILKHGRGVELHSESNPLPVWKAPELLVELDAGADPGP